MKEKQSGYWLFDRNDYEVKRGEAFTSPLHGTLLSFPEFFKKDTFSLRGRELLGHGPLAVYKWISCLLLICFSLSAQPTLSPAIGGGGVAKLTLTTSAPEIVGLIAPSLNGNLGCYWVLQTNPPVIWARASNGAWEAGGGDRCKIKLEANAPSYQLEITFGKGQLGIAGIWLMERGGIVESRWYRAGSWIIDNDSTAPLPILPIAKSPPEVEGYLEIALSDGRLIRAYIPRNYSGEIYLWEQNSKATYFANPKLVLPTLEQSPILGDWLAKVKIQDGRATHKEVQK